MREGVRIFRLSMLRLPLWLHLILRLAIVASTAPASSRCRCSCSLPSPDSSSENSLHSTASEDWRSTAVARAQSKPQKADTLRSREYLFVKTDSSRTEKESPTSVGQVRSLNRSFQRCLLLLFLRLVILRCPSPLPEKENRARAPKGERSWGETESSETEARSSRRRFVAEISTSTIEARARGDENSEEDTGQGETTGGGEQREGRLTGERVPVSRALHQYNPENQRTRDQETKPNAGQDFAKTRGGRFVSSRGKERKEDPGRRAHNVSRKRVRELAVAGAAAAHKEEKGTASLGRRPENAWRCEHVEVTEDANQEKVFEPEERGEREDEDSELQQREYLSAWLSFSPPVVRELGKALTEVKACQEWLEGFHDSPANAPLAALLWLQWARWLRRERGPLSSHSRERHEHSPPDRQEGGSRKTIPDERTRAEAKDRLTTECWQDASQGAPALGLRELDGGRQWWWNSRGEQSGGRSSLWAVAVSLSLLVGDREDVVGAAALLEFVLPEAFSLTQDQRRQETPADDQAMRLGEVGNEPRPAGQEAREDGRVPETGTDRGEGQDGTAGCRYRRIQPHSFQLHETTADVFQHGAPATASSLAHTVASCSLRAAATSPSSPPQALPPSDETAKQNRTKKQGGHGGRQEGGGEQKEHSSPQGHEHGMRQGKLRQTEAAACNSPTHKEDLDALRFCWFQLRRMQLPHHSLLLPETSSLFSKKRRQVSSCSRRGDVTENAAAKIRASLFTFAEESAPQ